MTAFLLSVVGLIALFMVCATIERCIELIYGPEDECICHEEEQ